MSLMSASMLLLSWSKLQISNQNPAHRFIQQDATKKLHWITHLLHAAMILALQNMDNPSAVFKNIHQHLAPQGLFAIVLNHPCFRIPRQSSWQIDQQNKLQYRRIDNYMSPIKIDSSTSWKRKRICSNLVISPSYLSIHSFYKPMDSPLI